MAFYQWKYEKSWGLRDVVCGVRRTYLNLWKLPCSWYWRQSSFYSAPAFCFWDSSGHAGELFLSPSMICLCPCQEHAWLTVRWASVPSKQQGSPQFWAQVQLFLFDASGQPWATCLLGVCVYPFWQCVASHVFGYCMLFARKLLN